MSALSQAQSEILDRLLVNKAARERIAFERAVLEERMAALLAEETNLLLRLQSKESGDDVPLSFDFDGKTIRWNGGSIRLGKKPYKFVKTLYFAKKRQTTV